MEFLMQPILRSMVLEEVSEKDIRMDALHYTVAAPPQEIPSSQTKASKSIEHVDPKKPGWARRHFNMYMQAMELVRLGDTSTEAYERLMDLFNNCMMEIRPYTELRDSLGLED